jgi:cytoskeletal protein CcmA (bactofilin family)
MFSKPKEPEAVSVPQQQTPPAPKRVSRPGVPSIISADLTLTGTVVSSGDVQIDGRVEGDVRVAALVIGETAEIKGDIYAEEVVVRGRVDGSVRARRVQLAATAHVEGNILHQTLAVESGAFFEGNCRHSENPIGDAEAGSRAAAKPSNGGAKSEAASAQSARPGEAPLFNG